LDEKTPIYVKIGRIFFISDKSTVLNKMGVSAKKLAGDLESQKEILKKLTDNINISSKAYNDLALKVVEGK